MNAVNDSHQCVDYLQTQSPERATRFQAVVQPPLKK